MRERKDVCLAELQRIADHVDGFVGVGAQHIERGERIALNGESRFPMASTYKIPIAALLLQQVDQGLVSLEQLISIEAQDYSPGSGSITPLFDKPGLAISVHNLLYVMLAISDNTATDVLLDLIGGPAAVNQFLADIGVTGLSVDRPVKYILADRYGFGAITSPESWSLNTFQMLYNVVTETHRLPDPLNNKLDCSTPVAMVSLLNRIYSEPILSNTSRGLLLETLYACKTGENRIKGYLPFHTPVAHKTGSFMGDGSGYVTNDVGIITLPEDHGHIAVAVFIKDSEQDNGFCETVIAHLSRTLYDYFLL